MKNMRAFKRRKNSNYMKQHLTLNQRTISEEGKLKYLHYTVKLQINHTELFFIILLDRRNMTSVQTSLEQLQLVDENKGDLDDFLGTSEANKTIATTSDIKELKDDLSSSEDERADILRDEDYDDV